MVKRPALLALATVPALALSACGSSSSSAGSTSPSSPAPASNSPVAVGGGSGIHVATTSLGQVLVDGSGRTVYMLTADTAGHSSCDASCLQYWPAVPPGAKTLTGVTAAVSSTAAIGGGKIATVGGWPLYTYVQDQKPGDVTGEGIATFGGVWYAVSPTGQPIQAAPSGGSSTAPAQGGY